MALHQLTATPAAGFDQPLGILSGCHNRILHFCTLLERLAAHLQAHGADGEAVESARLIDRYFSTAGKHHHRDEEDDLFPMLIGQDISLKTLVERLHEAHREMDACWEPLQAMLADLTSADTVEFVGLAERFVAMNREHVALENREMLPRAAMLLSNVQQEQLGRAMAKRRNVDYVSPANGDMA
jgi:hemerythrin-like domain-containing protein